MSSEFRSLAPHDLSDVVRNPLSLVLDIRSLATHHAGRLINAVPLSVPSTLLKRPLFSTDKLAEMLPTRVARRRFSEWRTAPRILVYDADSSVLVQGSNVLGLLTTDVTSALSDEEDETDDGMDSGEGAASGDSGSGSKPHHHHHHHHHHPHDGENEGDQGDVAEGSEALAMQFYRIELGEQRRLMGVMEHHSRQSGRVVGEGESAAKVSSKSGGGRGGSSGKKSKKKRKSKSGGDGRGNKGSPTAFPYSITAGVEKGAKNRYRNIWPFEHARVRLKARRAKRPSPQQQHAPSPSSTQTGGVGPLRPLPMPAKAAFLSPPFLTRGIGSMQLPPTTPSAGQSSDDYVNASYVQPLGTTKRYIATQGPLEETFVDFWTLVWEQNVHVIVMLTREVEGATIKSGNYWAGETYGPLRLKLLSTSGATDPQQRQQQTQQQQAPDDYFRTAPVRRPVPPTRRDTGGVLSPNDSDGLDQDNTIKRVFDLTHTAYPDLPPRRIVHLQYLGWPDMNVPDDTAGVLHLVRRVEREVERSAGPRLPKYWRERPKPGAEIPLRGGSGSSRSGSGSDRDSPSAGVDSGTRSVSGNASSTTSDDTSDPLSGIMRHALGERPVLLHCSAGVGRTGGFIAVDAVLDGIRREMRMRREMAAEALGSVKSAEEGSGRPGSGSRSGSGGGASGESADNEASGGGSAGVSGSGSGRGSEKNEETPGSGGYAMDVDGSQDDDEPSAGGQAAARDGPGLVMSLPVAGQSVHVPVARIDPTMDVDKPSPWTTGNPSRAVRHWTPGVGAERAPVDGTSRPGYRVLSPDTANSSVSGRAGSFFASPSPLPPSSAMSPSSSPPPSDANGSGSGSGFGFDSGNVSAGSSASGNSAAHRHAHQLASVAAANRTRTYLPLAAVAGTSAGSRQSQQMHAAQREGSADSTGSGSASSGATSGSVAGASGGSSSLFDATGSPEATQTSALLSSGSTPDVKERSGSSASSAAPLVPVPPVRARAETVRLASGSVGASAGANAGAQNIKVASSGSGSGSGSVSGSGSKTGSPPTFDYTLPRILHDDRQTPIALSSLDEPIRRVIEDMREQRMSLCQSLRQYVFVHRAVLEGALALVDEERAIYGSSWREADSMDVGGEEEEDDEMLPPVPFAPRPRKIKRKSSPTELPRENVKGEPVLTKRQSLKRKSISK